MSEYKGIDISNNNGAVNFANVSNNGVQVVYIKATEGATFRDPYTYSSFRGAKTFGMSVGFYHFLVATSSPEAQAENFYSVVSNYTADCIPMLDIETDFSNLNDYIGRFIAKFNALSGTNNIGIYSYTGFLDNISSKYSGYLLWEANYNNSPWELPSNSYHVIGHQYTEKGKVSGVETNCDINVFNDGVFVDNATKGSWIEENNKWWYRHTDGTYTVSNWEKIDGKWYLFNSEGWMCFEWQNNDGVWFYLGKDTDGSMKTGWVQTNSKWYYLDMESGEMRTGWVKYKDHWYYLDKTGAMQTGWIVVDGKDFMLYSDGSMVHDTIYCDYSFDSNGVATKIEEPATK